MVKTSADAPRVPRWTPLTRAVFRFLFVYLGLYSFASQIAGGMLLLPGLAFPSLGTRWPMREITLWLAAHVFGVAGPLLYAGNSGDTLFHWIQTLWLLTLAATITLLWLRFDRQRADDVRLYRWFRLFIRFALAAQLFYFGMAKVIPAQFPPPSLVTLVEPAGQLSRTDLLWTFIGSSTAYQMFAGWTEVTGAILLAIPATATLGAIVALADMTQVLALNMAFDVGLKQISFHLILMSLFLLAPDLPRLATVLFERQPVDDVDGPEVFSTPATNRRTLLLQVAAGGYLMAMFGRLAWRSWSSPGGGGYRKSDLYGIWDIARMSVDGEWRSPLLNDYDRRWRRVIFDAPDRIVFQRTDDSFAHYGASIDTARQAVAVTKGGSKNWKATFTYQRSTPNRLTLGGEMDGHVIRMDLQLVDLDTFRLINGGFRWIRPPDPYGG